MYDPLKLSLKIEQHIIPEGDQRKYYRFRGAKYYGGISTADVVGCNMNCAFCWVHPKVRYQVQEAGTFYVTLVVFTEDDQHFDTLDVTITGSAAGMTPTDIPIKDTPVIMVTALCEKHDIAAASAIGVEDYVTKPIDFTNLIEKISNILGNKKVKTG